MSVSIGWFTTGTDKAARDLLLNVHTAIRRHKLDAEIAFVFCNRSPGEADETNLLIRLVNSFNLPFVSISSAAFAGLPDWEKEYDRQLVEALGPLRSDICVLADYELKAGPELRREHNIFEMRHSAPAEMVADLQRIVNKQG